MKPGKPQPERDASFTKGTLCWQTGVHDWQPTTAPNYRKCQYSGCKAVQHLRGGWVYQFPNKPQVKPQQQTTSVEPQQTILDECDQIVIAVHAGSKQEKTLHEYWQG